MRKLTFLIYSLLCFGIGISKAQYTVIVNFDNATSPQGASPRGDVISVRNLLYGMTEYGGANNLGCIFSVDINGNNFRDLWDFNETHDSNGAQPSGDLLLLGGKLYGMTEFGV